MKRKSSQAICICCTAGNAEESEGETDLDRNEEANEEELDWGCLSINDIWNQKGACTYFVKQWLDFIV